MRKILSTETTSLMGGRMEWYSKPRRLLRGHSTIEANLLEVQNGRNTATKLSYIVILPFLRKTFTYELQIYN